MKWRPSPAWTNQPQLLLCVTADLLPHPPPTTAPSPPPPQGLVLDGEAERAGLRLIVVERPGFGRSPFNPHHSVLGWGDVILELADHLQVERFAVVGASGGGPFTAACALHIPRQRLVAVGLVCPLGTFMRNPPSAAAQRALLAVRFLPTRLQRLAIALVRTRIGLDKQYFAKYAHHPSDRAALQAHPAIATAMQASFVEGLAPGPAGLLHQLHILQEPWGFDLRDVHHPRVFMWHGLRDDMVPHASAALYERIPGCRPVYLPEDTHISIAFTTARLQMEAMRAAHLEADRAAAMTGWLAGPDTLIHQSAGC